MPALNPLLKRAQWLLGISVVGYCCLLAALTNPWLQRHALYAHAVNGKLFHDADKPQTFGFAKSQVTSFHLDTPDGEKLHAWHILPLDVYAENQVALVNEDELPGMERNATQSLSLRVLRDDPEARIIMNFHGNAGDIAQAIRTDTYAYFASLPRTHVLSIDYRGFGKSTGSPTEAGLITDGVTAVDWILDVANIPPERIVILGQSLGTAVTSAVSLYFADPASKDLPALPLSPHEPSSTPRESTFFAGVILVAPFSSLATVLEVYALGGFLPLMAPLMPFPYLLKMLLKTIVDSWPNALRIKAYRAALRDHPALLAAKRDGREFGQVQILHALDDSDISYRQGQMLTQIALDDAVLVPAEKRSVEIKDDRAPSISLSVVEYGGHNRIIVHSPVMLALRRAFAGQFGSARELDETMSRQV